MDDNRDKQKSATADNEPEQQPLPQQPPPITAEQKRKLREQYKRVQNMKATKRKHDFEDRRARIAEMLLPENRDKPVTLNSRDEYLAMDAAYKSLSNMTDVDGQAMEGHRETDADWVALTTRLAVAITDFTNVSDKPQNDHPGDGSTAVESVKSLSTLEVQLLAGKILMATRDAHVGRGKSSFSWPPIWNRELYTSFEQRFKETCSALTHNKKLVKSIMDVEFPPDMISVTAPRSELEAKKDNKRLRDRKAESKQMKKRLLEALGGGDDDGDAAVPQSAGAQKFKKRKRSYFMPRSAALKILERRHSRAAEGGADNDRDDQSPSSTGATRAESSTNDCLVIYGPYDDSLAPFDDDDDDV